MNEESNYLDAAVERAEAEITLAWAHAALVKTALGSSAERRALDAVETLQTALDTAIKQEASARIAMRNAHIHRRD